MKTRNNQRNRPAIAGVIMKKKVEAKKLSRKVNEHLRKILDYSWDDEREDYQSEADATMLNAEGELDLAKVVKDSTNHIFVSLAVVDEWLGQQWGPQDAIHQASTRNRQIGFCICEA